MKAVEQMLRQCDCVAIDGKLKLSFEARLEGLERTPDSVETTLWSSSLEVQTDGAWTIMENFDFELHSLEVCNVTKM